MIDQDDVHDEQGEDEDDRKPLRFDIHRESRSWTGEECDARIPYLVEEKLELVDGQLFWSDKTRRAFLGMLLENLGADAAVRLGDPAVWRAAVAALDSLSSG